MVRLFAFIIRIMIMLTRKVQKFLFYLDSRVNYGFDLDRHQYWVKRSARLHDMLKNEDEQYYARQYWTIIEKHLDELGCKASGDYLDLGCGQGRLTIPLAQWSDSAGGKVVGVDLSETAINQATKYVSQAGLNNAEFLVSDAGAYMESLQDNCLNGIFILEMLYFHPKFMDILRQSMRALKPGGLLVTSLRSQYFWLLDLVKMKTLDKVPMLLKERSGRLFGGDVWFNWNTSTEARSLFAQELGAEVIDLFGIGCCSGIPGDPHAHISLPSHLSREDRDMLMKLEMNMGHLIPDSGRYILVVSRKKDQYSG